MDVPQAFDGGGNRWGQPGHAAAGRHGLVFRSAPDGSDDRRGGRSVVLHWLAASGRVAAVAAGLAGRDQRDEPRPLGWHLGGGGRWAHRAGDGNWTLIYARARERRLTFVIGGDHGITIRCRDVASTLP